MKLYAQPPRGCTAQDMGAAAIDCKAIWVYLCSGTSGVSLFGGVCGFSTSTGCSLYACSEACGSSGCIARFSNCCMRLATAAIGACAPDLHMAQVIVGREHSGALLTWDILFDIREVCKAKVAAFQAQDCTRTSWIASARGCWRGQGLTFCLAERLNS